MKLVAVMAALVAALTCVVSSQAFVMPGSARPTGAAARAGQALAQPRVSPATNTRDSGEVSAPIYSCCAANVMEKVVLSSC